MGKNIPIHPRDKGFIDLMKKVVYSIRTSDEQLMKTVKQEFLNSNITLFYNQEKDLVRVVKQGSPAIDFKASSFEPIKK